MRIATKNHFTSTDKQQTFELCCGRSSSSSWSVGICQNTSEQEMESANDKRCKAPGRSVLNEYEPRSEVATDTEPPSTEDSAAVSTPIQPVPARIDRTIPQALITATSISAADSQTDSTRQQATSRATKAMRAEIQQQAKRILQTFEFIVREFKFSNWPDVNADLLESFEMGDIDTSWVVYRLDLELRNNALAMRHVLP